MLLAQGGKFEGANEDQTVGIKILARSIKEPLRQIVENAGEDAAVILNAVKAGKGAYGYNAGSGEYGDMIEQGILDPAKVTRLALQNAASVAGLLLTTRRPPAGNCRGFFVSARAILAKCDGYAEYATDEAPALHAARNAELGFAHHRSTLSTADV
jgi:hypothetical protein